MEKDEGVRIEECVGMTPKMYLCRLPSLPDKLRVSRRLGNWNAIGTRGVFMRNLDWHMATIRWSLARYRGECASRTFTTRSAHQPATSNAHKPDLYNSDGDRCDGEYQ
jgi:hypothetical protein